MLKTPHHLMTFNSVMIIKYSLPPEIKVSYWQCTGTALVLERIPTQNSNKSNIFQEECTGMVKLCILFRKSFVIHFIHFTSALDQAVIKDLLDKALRSRPTLKTFHIL